MKGKKKKILSAEQIDRFENNSPRQIARGKATRGKKTRFLIVCEGVNTEPSYFRKFRMSFAEIKIIGQGISASELVNKVSRMPDLDSYDEVWCVYDRDDRIDGFNQSLTLARKFGFKVAYSIQAFEYWLLLHFIDHDGSPLHRKEYLKRINQVLEKLGAPVIDSSAKLLSSELFFILQNYRNPAGKSLQDLAIERAKKIFNRYDHSNPSSEESSTTVFMLVEEMLKHS